MREIALDTETTGLDPKQGHRVVEIGGVEMMYRIKTGRSFQVYLNPEREMPEAAFRIHGLTTEFLASQKRFLEIVDGFLEFIGDAPLVMHNGEFDLAFINAELSRIGRTTVAAHRLVDTLAIARKKFPGSPANLNALCKRFNIDLSERQKHGALLDSELLADVYLELMGGSQEALELRATKTVTTLADKASQGTLVPRAHFPSEEEKAAHQQFLQKIKVPAWAE